MLDWDHAYGIPSYIDDDDFRWEISHGMGGLDDYHPVGPFPRICGYDPSVRPSHQPRTEVVPIIAQSMYQYRQSSICPDKSVFAKLPWEIRELIARLLPTKTALQLRLASRSFRPLIDSQSFWASRFERDNDRGHLFEFAGTKRFDWPSLYWHLSSKRCSYGLRNRNRIWKLLKLTRTLIDTRLSAEYHLLKPTTSDYQWTGVTADITPDGQIDLWYPSCEHSCCQLGSKGAFIPDQLAELRVSVLQMGISTYIAGLQLVTSSGHRTTFGYFDDSRLFAFKLRNIQGFDLAVGIRGIQALRVIDETGRASAWAGDPNDVPRSRLLWSGQKIGALLVGFDVCARVCSSISLR